MLWKKMETTKDMTDFTEDVTLNNVGFTNANYESKPVDANNLPQLQLVHQNGDAFTTNTSNLKRPSDKHKKSEIILIKEKKLRRKNLKIN